MISHVTDRRGEFVRRGRAVVVAVVFLVATQVSGFDELPAWVRVGAVTLAVLIMAGAVTSGMENLVNPAIGDGIETGPAERHPGLFRRGWIEHVPWATYWLVLFAMAGMCWYEVVDVLLGVFSGPAWVWDVAALIVVGILGVLASTAAEAVVDGNRTGSVGTVVAVVMIVIFIGAVTAAATWLHWTRAIGDLVVPGRPWLVATTVITQLFAGCLVMSGIVAPGRHRRLRLETAGGRAGWLPAFVITAPAVFLLCALTVGAYGAAFPRVNEALALLVVLVLVGLAAYLAGFIGTVLAVRTIRRHVPTGLRAALILAVIGWLLVGIVVAMVHIASMHSVPFAGGAGGSGSPVAAPAVAGGLYLMAGTVLGLVAFLRRGKRPRWSI